MSPEPTQNRSRPPGLHRLAVTESAGASGRTRRRHAHAWRAWNPANQLAWLARETFVQEVQPRLRTLSVSELMSALQISKSYSSQLREGRRLPHARHWLTLATLVGIGDPELNTGVIK